MVMERLCTFLLSAECLQTAWDLGERVVLEQIANIACRNYLDVATY